MLIDIHSHLYLSSQLDALAKRVSPPMVTRRHAIDKLLIFPNEEEFLGSSGPLPPSFSSIEAKLQFMEQSGIAVSIISAGNPWVDPFDPGVAVVLAAAMNDELSGIVAGHAPLEGLGVLPVQHAAAAADEVERIATSLPLIGVILGTRPAGGHLDDAHMEPVWSALERHRLPVLLHPHYALGYDWMGGHGHTMPVALAFPFETTAAATRMVLGGVVDRYPGLDVILSHAGGVLPYLMGRLDACLRVGDRDSAGARKSIQDYLRWFYYDAITFHAGPLRLLLDVVGSGRCMFGTDHPFAIADPASVSMAIDEAAHDPHMRSAIRGGTAEAWIGTGFLTEEILGGAQ